ncbi:DUF1573 domain-containing protein [Flavobacterium columnare NBRC 100251 = ATCC 23463]|uniref:DUF1573 domain-containing protein n=2 Tax=Flavobacterium columnare TaxID=996 RepID=G8X858_FLACA|nr:DUF1573 domain-containing protein [Flavobacterium columnare]AEW84995.1 hypothetical protein FCOL_00720 [Flavobacterium columnare ATCC 49512]AMO19341.1 DUF1573 domain-containing protein [Flavobacterium columnare]ANO49231.1 hypothetical protein Pf1_00983 [Flavobacterium columnare]APT22780.1 hypothetical protein BU993_09215 [Flavobacterium columnare]AUX17281.1 hypothetical protein AQ623_02450 [Flavobacterium columnare]
MKRILFFTILVLFSFSLQAQSGAKIEFKTHEIDYGTISKSTDNGIRFFEFTNTGDAPLIIKNVQSTCGCTIPSFSKEAVGPGQSGKIEVKYNMNPGPIRKSIMVESNAINTENGLTPLKIKGTVELN